MALWANIASGISAGAAIAAFVVLIATLWATQDSLTAARQSAAEARQQAVAAREANEISSRALAAAVSSSVYFGSPVIRLRPQPDGSFVRAIEATMGNSGGSATRGLSYNVICKPSEGPLAEPFDIGALKASQTYYAVLAPKEVKNPIACSQAALEVPTITFVRLSIYILGAATYRDTVDFNRVHHVEFYTRLFDFAGAAGQAASEENCDHHNCIDDECEAS